MESLIVSFNAVAPIILMVSLGYFLKSRKVFDKHTLGMVNNVCFKVFLPILLFMNVYTTKISQIFNGKLLIFLIVAVLSIFGILSILVPIFEKEPNRRGVLIQGIFRSNFVILGIPLAMAVYGPESTGLTSMLIAVIIPLYNILAVITLEIHSGGKIALGKVLKGIAGNPLIIFTFLGIFFLVTGIKLPRFLESTLTDISKIATPLSIIVLGGSFEFSKVARNKKQLFFGVLGRLVIVPLVVVSAAIMAGFRGMVLMVLVTIFATPTAISSFVMAQNMGGDGELAGQQVVFTSMFAGITVFLWIFVLRSMGFI